MAFCEQCGAQIMDGDRFCERCGAPVEAPPSQQVDATTVMPQPTFQKIDGQGAPISDAATRVGIGVPQKSMLPRIVGILVAVAAVAFVALYAVPLFIWHPHDPHEDEANLPPEERLAQEDGTLDDMPEETVEPKAEVKSPQETQPTSNGATTQTKAAPSSADYTTSDTPTIGEFAWFRDDPDAVGPGNEATPLTSFESVQGGWKAYILNDPAVEGAAPFEELLNVYVGGSEEKATVTLDWYYARDTATGESWENTGIDSAYSGSWANGGIDALGSGRVHLTSFWLEGDHEYALGSVSWPDATGGRIALVRP